MTDRDSKNPSLHSRRNFLKTSIAVAGTVGGVAALA